MTTQVTIGTGGAGLGDCGAVVLDGQRYSDFGAAKRAFLAAGGGSLPTTPEAQSYTWDPATCELVRRPTTEETFVVSDADAARLGFAPLPAREPLDLSAFDRWL